MYLVAPYSLRQSISFRVYSLKRTLCDAHKEEGDIHIKLQHTNCFIFFWLGKLWPIRPFADLRTFFSAQKNSLIRAKKYNNSIIFRTSPMYLWINTQIRKWTYLWKYGALVFLLYRLNEWRCSASPAGLGCSLDGIDKLDSLMLAQQGAMLAPSVTGESSFSHSPRCNRDSLVKTSYYIV
jgi:hypothetical protein